MSPRDRYQRDPMFTHLVDSFYIAIEAAQYTPTEIREAAMLAQIIYEEKHIRPIFLDERQQIARINRSTGPWSPSDRDWDNPYDASIKRGK